MNGNNEAIVWRKLPVGIIRDEDMDLITDQLPPHLKAAPYMFYMTALCKADNDGIFDLEDGVIFSRLMRIGTPQDVFLIANLMLSRKIIQRAGTSTRCIFTDWEYSIKQAPRTIEDRRAIVTKQIEEERRNNQVTHFSLNSNASTAAPAADFFCPVNDIKTENVVKTFYDDKNAKNVVEKNETEREIEREIERKDTQEQKDKREEKQTLRPLMGLQVCEEETAENPEIVDQTPGETLTEMVDKLWVNTTGQHIPQAQVEESVENDEKQDPVFKVVADFFTKNNLGFNVAACYELINAIVSRIKAIEDSRNPAEVVASVILGQFAKLTEEPGYYHNAPLTPEQLLKPGMYSHVMQQANRILRIKETSANWQAQQKQLEEEIAQEKAAVGNVYDDVYVKYGIDPQDPNRTVKLMHAKASESKENDPP